MMTTTGPAQLRCFHCAALINLLCHQHVLPICQECSGRLTVMLWTIRSDNGIKFEPI